MRKPLKKKLNPLAIILPCAIVLIIAGILVYMWQTKWKKDPKPPVVETNTSAFTEDFYGTWHVAHGKADHSISLLPNGYGIYKSGSKVDTVRYSSDEANKITVWIDGYTYDFELDGDTLVRYRKGKADGYTYHKHEE